MLSIVQTKTQEQGLTGYSSVRLTSRASHKLGKCRLSWVWLGFWLLSALSECSACSGRGSHRHASSGFAFGTNSPDSSVLTWPRPYTCLSFYTHHVFLFTLITLFSQEFLLHSSGHAVLVRSFSYTPRAGFIEEFLLRSSSFFSFLFCIEQFLLHSSSWF